MTVFYLPNIWRLAHLCCTPKKAKQIVLITVVIENGLKTKDNLGSDVQERHVNRDTGVRLSFTEAIMFHCLFNTSFKIL